MLKTRWHDRGRFFCVLQLHVAAECLLPFSVPEKHPIFYRACYATMLLFNWQQALRLWNTEAPPSVLPISCLI